MRAMEAGCSQRGSSDQSHQSTWQTGVDHTCSIWKFFFLRSELDAHSRSGRKLSISHSILGRSRPGLAVSPVCCVLQGIVSFLNFILQFFAAALFEPDHKFTAIESDVVYGQCASGCITGRAPEQGKWPREVFPTITTASRTLGAKSIETRTQNTKHKTLITH